MSSHSTINEYPSAVELLITIREAEKRFYGCSLTIREPERITSLHAVKRRTPRFRRGKTVNRPEIALIRRFRQLSLGSVGEYNKILRQFQLIILSAWNSTLGGIVRPISFAFQIDDELEPRRLLHWEIGGLPTLQDLST